MGQRRLLLIAILLLAPALAGTPDAGTQVASSHEVHHEPRSAVAQGVYVHLSARNGTCG